MGRIRIYHTDYLEISGISAATVVAAFPQGGSTVSDAPVLFIDVEVADLGVNAIERKIRRLESGLPHKLRYEPIARAFARTGFPRKGQTWKGSVMESFVHTFSGMLLAWLITQFVLVPLFDISLSTHDNTIITLVLTGVSLIRGYVVRRGFNWYYKRGK
jgi:hypothetical protein